MRVKWTDCSGRAIEAGQRLKFVDFLGILKQEQPLWTVNLEKTLILSGQMGGQAITKAEAVLDLIDFLTNFHN